MVGKRQHQINMPRPVAYDARERANLARRAPQELDRMRGLYEEWNRGMPAIPTEAVFEVVFTKKDMP